MSTRYYFDPNQPYRLIRVTDSHGVDKAQFDSLYMERLRCVTDQISYDVFETYGGHHRLRMTFVQDEDGNPIRRGLLTSFVSKVEEQGEELHIHTQNSIYILKKAELAKPKYRGDVSNLIELYLSSVEDHSFARGVYYDEAKQPHELKECVHIGMIRDSVLLDMEGSVEPITVARYFPGANSITFYDTLYQEQDYSTPMLIHNTGKTDLVIWFQFYDHQWTIAPGEAKPITPFQPDGADPMEAADADWSGNETYGDDWLNSEEAAKFLKGE